MKTRPFSLRELFKDIFTGEYHVSANLDTGAIPLISCKTLDYGVEGYFDIPSNHVRSNCVTIACDGMNPLTSFYHKYGIAAKDNVLICIPFEKMKLATIYYIISYLNKSRWRFSYGRKFYENKIPKMKVPLPIKANGEIDEDFIEQNIKYSYRGEKITQKKNDKKPARFKNFKLEDLGIKPNRKYALYMNQLEEGRTPYVTTTETDNGISTFVDENPNFSKGTLTISLDGTCGTSFYQFENFIAGEKTAVIENPQSEPYFLFYLGAIIRLKSWRYHYGRKLSMKRLANFDLPFPVDSEGKIDFTCVRELVEGIHGWNIVEKHTIK